MEWTIERLRFVGMKPAYNLSLTIDPVTTQVSNKHNVLIEWMERPGLWQARDAVDRGNPAESLIAAIASYIDISRARNVTWRVGHCAWMVEQGLPFIEKHLSVIGHQIMAIHENRQESMN